MDDWQKTKELWSHAYLKIVCANGEVSKVIIMIYIASPKEQNVFCVQSDYFMYM